MAEEPRRSGKRDLFDLDSGAWVEIPGGTFPMGAQKEDPRAPGYDPGAQDEESPVRRVTVSPFRLSRHPVTNAEYAIFVEETNMKPPEHWEGGRIPEGKEEHPVVGVSWSDAVAFCEWVSKAEVSKETTRRVRLPTEAEWELAARGADGRKYPWGDVEPNDRLANFGMNVGGTTPVGSYPDGATPEGVQDLAGNVLEWCADWFGGYPAEDETDPLGPKSGASRVLRGGSFVNAPRDLRAACRSHGPPENRIDFIGFRVLCVSSGGL